METVLLVGFAGPSSQHRVTFFRNVDKLRAELAKRGYELSPEKAEELRHAEFLVRRGRSSDGAWLSARVQDSANLARETDGHQWWSPMTDEAAIAFMSSGLPLVHLAVGTPPSIVHAKRKGSKGKRRQQTNQQMQRPEPGTLKPILRVATHTPTPLHEVDPGPAYRGTFSRIFPADRLPPALHMRKVIVANRDGIPRHDPHLRESVRGYGSEIFAWESRRAHEAGLEILCLDGNYGPDDLEKPPGPLYDWYRAHGFLDMAPFTLPEQPGDKGRPIHLVRFFRSTAPYAVTGFGLNKSDNQTGFATPSRMALIDNELADILQAHGREPWLQNLLGRSDPWSRDRYPFDERSGSLLVSPQHISTRTHSQVARAVSSLWVPTGIWSAGSYLEAYKMSSFPTPTGDAGKPCKSEQDVEDALVAWLTLEPAGMRRELDRKEHDGFARLLAAMLISRGLVDADGWVRANRASRTDPAGVPATAFNVAELNPDLNHLPPYGLAPIRDSMISHIFGHLNAIDEALGTAVSTLLPDTKSRITERMHPVPGDMTAHALTVGQTLLVLSVQTDRELARSQPGFRAIIPIRWEWVSVNAAGRTWLSTHELYSHYSGLAKSPELDITAYDAGFIKAPADDDGVIHLPAGCGPAIAFDASGEMTLVLPPDHKEKLTVGQRLAVGDGLTFDCLNLGGVVSDIMSHPLPSSLTGFHPSPMNREVAPAFTNT